MQKSTEQDYSDIRKLGTKLHIPTPEMFWGFKVEMPNEEIVHEHEERGHSWVRNAYNALVGQFCAVNGNGSIYGDGNINYLATNASLMTLSPLTLMYSTPETSPYGFLGAVGSNTTGIVVGTGTAPYHFDQFRLNKIIANGTSNGQISHQASNAPVKTWDSSGRNYSASFSRIYNNNGSTDITITEVGIYCNMGSNYAMAVRDVLSVPVLVPAGGKLTITYVINVTFPSVSTGNTLHLIQFDNSWDDERGRQWTLYNTGSLSSAQVKFGTNSLLLSSTNANLSYPLSADFNFGSADFTAEIQLYVPSSGSAIFGGSSSYAPFGITVTSNKIVYFISSNQTSYNVASNLYGTLSVSYNAWHHFALVRYGNTLSSYVDGVLDKTFDVTGMSFNLGSAMNFNLGYSSGYNTVVGTYLDSFRLSKIARYTAPFTPPTSAFILD